MSRLIYSLLYCTCGWQMFDVVGKPVVVVLMCGRVGLGVLREGLDSVGKGSSTVPGGIRNIFGIFPEGLYILLFSRLLDGSQPPRPKFPYIDALE